MSEPSTEAERAALEELGYSQRWLEAGLLDRALLAEQRARLLAGGTRKTGKYRAEALAAWRERSACFDTQQLDAFLALMRDDPDAKLAHAAIAALIESPALGLDQLEHVARADPKLMQRHQALIRRTYLSRRLEGGVTDEVMQQVVDSQDAFIQSRLMRDARLSRKQAELLAKRGANPTIRDNAQAWVQDKKAWR